MDQSEPRRAGDREEEDYREQRRPITGDEMRIGVGKYAITVRGGITIIVVLGLAILGLTGFVVKEIQRVEAQQAREHDNRHREQIDTMRLFVCVLSLSKEERDQWRVARDARNALTTFCPGLLMATPDR